MNNFEKQLEKWNNGILRGAQAKLAKCLQVTTATVALWATGKRRPSKGYITTMARLFGLDESGVQRLFMVTAPTTVSPFWTDTPTGILRDAPSMGNYTIEPHSTVLTPTVKNVSLPVFTKMPASYPMFRHRQVRSWWTLPAQEAHKARFLFALPSKNDRERLLFVQPCTTWKANKYMLVAGTKEYAVCYVKKVGNTPALQMENGPTCPTKKFSPIGVIVRKICQL